MPVWAEPLPWRIHGIKGDFKILSGYKTYILAAVTVIGAAAAYLVGDTTLQEALAIVVPAVSGAFVRHGIATTAAK